MSKLSSNLFNSESIENQYFEWIENSWELSEDYELANMPMAFRSQLTGMTLKPYLGEQYFNRIKLLCTMKFPIISLINEKRDQIILGKQSILAGQGINIMKGKVVLEEETLPNGLGRKCIVLEYLKNGAALSVFIQFIVVQKNELKVCPNPLNLFPNLEKASSSKMDGTISRSEKKIIKLLTDKMDEDLSFPLLQKDSLINVLLPKSRNYVFNIYVVQKLNSILDLMKDILDD
ncbi:MAG: hypothetical protein WDZ28_04275 [Simkaniaceae bacterium]